MVVTRLKALLGDRLVESWEDAQPFLQSSLGHVSAASPPVQAIAFPETIEQLAELVAWASTENCRLLPMGSGSKLSWGGLLSESPISGNKQFLSTPAGHPVTIAVSLSKLNRIIEHAVGDLTLTAEAGVTLADVRGLLFPMRQQLGVDPAFASRATLGGIVATGDTGSLRQAFGSVRDRVLGLSFVRSDGQVVKAGGRVVKNVAGYDLMKLMTGAYGTLGILAQMTLRLFPVPDCSRTIVVSGPIQKLGTFVQRIRSSSLSPTRMDWLSVSCAETIAETAGHPGAILQFHSIADSVERQIAQALAWGGELGLTAHGQVDDEAIWDELQVTLKRSQPVNGLAVDGLAVDGLATDRLATDGLVNDSNGIVGCKVGILPARVDRLLTALDVSAFAQIHARSGIGWISFRECPSVEQLTQLRAICQQHQGYLLLLQAPKSLKRTFDIWGYAESNLALMRSLSRKFDPNNIFCSERLLPTGLLTDDG